MMDHLERIGSRLAAARRFESTVRAQAKRAAIKAIEAGGSEVKVAEKLGVDRMTVRKWLGK